MPPLAVGGRAAVAAVGVAVAASVAEAVMSGGGRSPSSLLMHERLASTRLGPNEAVEAGR